jgi:glycosidase
VGSQRGRVRRACRLGGSLVVVLCLAAAIPPAAGAAGGVVAGGAAEPAAPGRDASGPLAIDGTIRDADLWHDSRDDRYRTPGGAVPAGTSVRIRLRAAAGDLESAQLRLADRLDGSATVLPMAVAASDPDGGEHGYAYWEAVVDTGPASAILDYTILAQDGASSRILSDDRAEDGGSGQIGRDEAGVPWQLTVYEPDFQTPAWAPGSVVYQVFPDRFADADPGNDPSPDATPGPSGAEVYRHGDVHGEPIVVKAWDERPEGYCRAYQPEPCDEQALNRDFFGGDLAGITAGLDDLADLGVTVLYLNPIFASPSNHRYDTSDYAVIDPDLGTDADFDALIAAARARGIRVVLDGVFNHVSADSPWFDRFRRYEAVGACEDAASPYRDWFTFRAPGPGQPAPCAPSTPGGSDTYYDSWWDFDSIPELRETPEVVAMISGAQGVVAEWIGRGTAGWRLDVADSMSAELQAAIREAAKAASEDAIVIAEQWQDSTPWLLGDQADSTMNYRFRRAVIGLVNGATADPDGSIEALAPSDFAAAMLGVREDYPGPAYQALLNLVDSHDTARILWTLTPGQDNEAAKTEPMALAEGRDKLRLLSTIQLTFPGMASIYYGDEVGLTGFDDPDDRRPYPWGDEDLALREHYQGLARLRAEHEALREGDLDFLLAEDATRTLAYLRRSNAAAAVVALNLGDRQRHLDIDVSGRIPDGITLSDALGTHAPVAVQEGTLRLTLGPMTAAVLLSPDDADLVAPDAPAELSARADADAVNLAWPAVEGAAGYQVWRSLLTGGGYELVGDAAVARPGSPAFHDAAARPGVAQHYVVTAVDAAGNVSGRSPEAVAVPEVAIGDVRLVGLLDADGAPATNLQRALSAADGAMAVSVAVELAASGDAAGDTAGAAAAEAARTAAGIIVETGLAPLGEPADGAAWSWTRAAPSASHEGRLSFVGTVQPEAPGTYAVAARASTDGGATWRPASGTATLEAVTGADRTAPTVPAAPELVDVSAASVRLRWAASDAADLLRYVVQRAELQPGSTTAPADPAAYVVVGRPTDPVFVDASVTPGAAYAYAVAAQDTAYNTSARSEALAVVARLRLVDVVFGVAVPPNTPSDERVTIAGDFQGWDPAATPMTLQDDGSWAITLSFPEGTALQYKYARGSWEAVEKDAGCGELANRSLTVEADDAGGQVVADTIDKWRDLDACG